MITPSLLLLVRALRMGSLLGVGRTFRGVNTGVNPNLLKMCNGESMENLERLVARGRGDPQSALVQPCRAAELLFPVGSRVRALLRPLLPQQRCHAARRCRPRAPRAASSRRRSARQGTSTESARFRFRLGRGRNGARARRTSGINAQWARRGGSPHPCAVDPCCCAPGRGLRSAEGREAARSP